ncbi:glycoside hydrolase family 73 protein [Companilactobacillus musae]|uniref:glycoside hydrolase family 73 protein n=1 Tax=Companilactobacillus musae TaxID=1903258 RepID=UPI000E65C2B1|nr:glycoside hydrolase family 73 protein [Companilactobacillus musae]
MNKKWVASTALASFLAAVGVSSNASPVKAAVSNDDGNQDDQDQQKSDAKDPNVASVMDQQGAPIDENAADAIEAGEETNSNSVLPANAVRAITQSGAVTQGVSQSQQSAFISKVGPIAQQVASKYNVYASVSMAQAIVESAWGTSDLSAKYNNYFGVKGDYNGSFVSFPTQEWSAEKGYYTIYDNFRSYPSIYDSFADNASLLRNGISGAGDFYKGTWKENTSSYKDATSWLQGRYATSPVYASTLNRIIETYNLTQYDSDANTNGISDSSVNGTQTSIDDTATITKNGVASIYINANPNQIVSNRALANNTEWHVSSKVVAADGTVYYQVASNEYVKADDVQLASEKSNPKVKIADTAIVINNAGSKVYKAANTKSATDRVLPYQSAWITTAYVVDDEGNTFYFVGNDAYVLANDVTLKSQIANDDYKEDQISSYPDIVHVIATPSARAYDSKHNVLAVSLANGTDWKIDQKSVHSDGSVWYRVATDQWVNANDVQVKGSNYVTSVSGMVKINYIPGYGVNVYNSPATNNKFTGARLADGTTWRVTSKQIVDGQTWYKVNAGWVNGKYCIYNAD